MTQSARRLIRRRALCVVALSAAKGLRTGEAPAPTDHASPSLRSGRHRYFGIAMPCFFEAPSHQLQPQPTAFPSMKTTGLIFRQGIESFGSALLRA